MTDQITDQSIEERYLEQIEQASALAVAMIKDPDSDAGRGFNLRALLFSKAPAEIKHLAPIEVVVEADASISVLVHHPAILREPRRIGRVSADNLKLIFNETDTYLPGFFEDHFDPTLFSVFGAEKLAARYPELCFLASCYARVFMFDQKTINHIQARSAEILHELIGESERDVADSGRYIPGSAKEAAALRKIRKAKKIEVSLSDEERIIQVGKKVNRAIDTVKAGALKLNAAFVKTLEPDHEGLVSLAYGLTSWDKARWRNLIKSRLYTPFKTHEIELIEAFADSIGGFSEQMTELIKNKSKDIDSELKGAAARVINSLQDFESSDNRILSSVAERTINTMQNFISGELTDGLRVLAEWYGKKILAHTSAAGKKDNEVYRALVEAKKRPMQPEFKRKGGVDVDDISSAERLLEICGLSASQFGKSIPDDERVELIKRTAAALLDLADCLNIEPDQIGMSKSLSIALGSRGSPHLSVAHYEPAYKIINFSRKNGFDGSAAHEWAHALDYGEEGVSFFGKASDKSDWADDADVKEAFDRVVRTLFSGQKDRFIENRQKEADRWKELDEKATALFRQKEEALRQEKKERQTKELGPIDEQIKKLRSADDLSQADKDKIVELERKKTRLSNLINSEFYLRQCNNNKIISRAYAFREYRRLCLVAIKRAEASLELTKIHSLEASMPKDFVDKNFDSKNWIPSETIWRSALLGALEPPSKRSYWTDPKEVFARSFEVWIRQKLDGMGRTNNMLVSEAYSSGPFSPYPDATSCPDLSEAMNEFVEVLKMKKYL